MPSLNLTKTPTPVAEAPTAVEHPAEGGREQFLRAASRSHRRFIDRDLVLDASMLALAAVASIASAPAAGVSTDVVALVVFAVLVLAGLGQAGLYRPRFAPHFLEDALKIVGVTAIVAMAMTFMRVLIFDNPQAAAQAARAWVFASTYLIAARGGRHLIEMKQRRAGTSGRRTLIVGAGNVGREFAQRLLERPDFGLRPVAFLDDDPLEMEDPAGVHIPVLDSGRQDDADSDMFGPRLEEAIAKLHIAHVIVSFSTTSHSAELDLLRRCQAMGVSVSVMPRLFEGVTDRLDLERIGGMGIISVHPTDPDGWQFAVKYGIDRVAAAIALIIASPLLILAALLTLATLGRPIIFRQARIGLDGREFDVLKFRTMRLPKPGEPTEAEVEDRMALGLGPGGVEGADRRTRVGTFLRKTSIDELPQLFNVLRGDMSLVGPRPERPQFARMFDESIYRYADRNRVKSGITGWSQVNGLRGKTSITQRAEWDNYYIENRSVWLDLKIMAMTIPAVLRHRE